jgi:hypothetical protein
MDRIASSLWTEFRHHYGQNFVIIMDRIASSLWTELRRHYGQNCVVIMDRIACAFISHFHEEISFQVAEEWLCIIDLWMLASFFLLKSWATQNSITIKSSWNTND